VRRTLLSAQARSSPVSTRERRRIPPLRWFCRWFLVAVFAWSAGGKLLWPGEFEAIVKATGFVPGRLVLPITYGAPIIELLVSASLAVNYLVPIALWIAAFLSLMFLGTHGAVVFLGDRIPCGCIGVQIDPSTRGFHVTMVFVCLGMATGALFLLFSTPWKPREGPTHPEDVADESA
jgi:hypothetical protein